MTNPLVKVASDPDQVRKGREKEELARLQEEQDLRVVLGTPEGRRWMLRLVDECGYTSMALGVADKPGQMAFNEGVRSVAVAIMTEVKRVVPDLFYKAVMEAQEAELVERRRQEARREQKRQREREREEKEHVAEERA